MKIADLFKTRIPKPYVMSETEHYIVFGGYDFRGPDDALNIAEALRKEGYKPLSFGNNGGVYCEKVAKKERWAELTESEMNIVNISKS